jgi:hypothetical protein
MAVFETCGWNLAGAVLENGAADRALNLCPTLCHLARPTAFLDVFYNDSGNILWFRITYSFYSILTTSTKVLALFITLWYLIVTRGNLPPHSENVAQHSMIEPFC